MDFPSPTGNIAKTSLLTKIFSITSSCFDLNVE